jgi:hypothetical protein
MLEGRQQVSGTRSLKPGRDGNSAVKNSYATKKVLAKYPGLSSQQVSECLTYSTFVDVKRRYMFFAVPKAACTTMKALLHRMNGDPPLTYDLGEVETRRGMFVHQRRNVPLPSLHDLDDPTQEKVLTSPDFFRFAIVRNPYTRLISAWRSKVALCEPGFEYVYRDVRGSLPQSHNDLISFPEFLDYVERSDPAAYDPHWMLQTDHLFHDALQFSFLGKMENLGDALARFQLHLGNREQVGVDNSNQAAYREAVTLSGDQAHRIYKIYQNDFEKLGYGRADIPPSGNVEGALTSGERGDRYGEVLERNLIIGMLVRERNDLMARVGTSGVPRGRVGRKLRRFLLGKQD